MQGELLSTTAYGPQKLYFGRAESNFTIPVLADTETVQSGSMNCPGKGSLKFRMEQAPVVRFKFGDSRYHRNLRDAKLSVRVQCYIYPLFVRIHADPVPWQVPWQVSVLCHETTPTALAPSVMGSPLSFNRNGGARSSCYYFSWHPRS
jgi:hypothetical protein